MLSYVSDFHGRREKVRGGGDGERIKSLRWKNKENNFEIFPSDVYIETIFRASKLLRFSFERKSRRAWCMSDVLDSGESKAFAMNYLG